MYAKLFDILIAPFVGGSSLLGLIGFIAIPGLSFLLGSAVLSFETKGLRENHDVKTLAPLVLPAIGLIEGAISVFAATMHMGVADFYLGIGHWFEIAELVGLVITIVSLLPYGLFRTIQCTLGYLLWGFTAFSVAFIVLSFVHAGFMMAALVFLLIAYFMLQG